MDNSEYSNSKNESDNESTCSYTESYNSDEDSDEEDVDLINIFTKKEICRYKMIDKFFSNRAEKDIQKMIDIINGKSDISLRILDWFVTKYSRKNIDCGISTSYEKFDVRISYKAQLKTFKKRYFDPFRRRKKFKYCIVTDKFQISVRTTLGQLNFFKWALSNNIIEYVEKNLAKITKAMNISNKEDKKRKKSKNEKIEKDKTLKNIENKDTIKVNTKTQKNIENELVLTFD